MNYSGSSKSFFENKGNLFSNYSLLFFLMNTNKNSLEKLIKSSTEKHKEISKIIIQTSIKEILLNPENKNNISSNDNLIILTKGISYWKELNINSLLYSKKLNETLSQLKIEENEIQNEEILKHKVTNIINNLNKNPKIEGTSTYCLVYIDKVKMRMLSISMGDSLYSIMRLDNKSQKYRIEYMSKEKYHSFNTPYQVGKFGDSNEYSITKSYDILENDILIIGNDCFWDNISINSILDIINEISIFNLNYQNIICEKLIEEAKKNSDDQFLISPFSIKAKENGFYYLGGKPGDIILSVSIIKYNNVNNKNDYIKESEFDQYSITSKFTSNTSIMNDLLN